MHQTVEAGCLLAKAFGVSAAYSAFRDPKSSSLEFIEKGSAGYAEP
jgi:hypothetical protein